MKAKKEKYESKLVCQKKRYEEKLLNQKILFAENLISSKKLSLSERAETTELDEIEVGRIKNRMED